MLHLCLNLPNLLNVGRVYRVLKHLLWSLTGLETTYVKNHGQYPGREGHDKNGKRIYAEKGLIATRTEEYERHDQRPV